MNATVDRMARPTKPPTENVRMASDVARTCRMVAAALGKSLPDFLTEEMRPIADAKLKKIMEAKEAKKPKGKP